MLNASVDHLHSVGASGQVGKVWIYSSWRGVSYRKAYVIPFDPQTGQQLACRNKFRNGMIAWGNLTLEEKAEYKERSKAYGGRMLAHNYFLYLYLRDLI